MSDTLYVNENWQVISQKDLRYYCLRVPTILLFYFVHFTLCYVMFRTLYIMLHNVSYTLRYVPPYTPRREHTGGSDFLTYQILMSECLTTLCPRTTVSTSTPEVFLTRWTDYEELHRGVREFSKHHRKDPFLWWLLSETPLPTTILPK